MIMEKGVQLPKLQPSDRLRSFLERNRPSQKRMAELRERYKDRAESRGDKAFWDSYYSLDLYLLHESSDFDLNLRTFDVLKDLVFPDSRVIDLCCRSGFFGVYLASSRPDIMYMGIDMHPVAIEKAKELASANGLSPDIFICADYRAKARLFFSFEQYKASENRHDTIIGRNLTNTRNYGIDAQAIETITRMADDLIVLHFSYDRALKMDLMYLKFSYEKYGFTFVQVSDFVESEALFTGVGCFVYTARKYFR
jgi:tRNA G46 methylase TrmB